MDQIILVGILVVLAIPFYFGIKRIIAMFSKKGSSCGCGSNDCKCSSNGDSCSSEKGTGHRSMQFQSICTKLLISVLSRIILVANIFIHARQWQIIEVACSLQTQADAKAHQYCYKNMVLPKIAKPSSYLYYDISIQLSAGVFEFLVRTSQC